MEQQRAAQMQEQVFAPSIIVSSCLYWVSFDNDARDWSGKAPDTQEQVYFPFIVGFFCVCIRSLFDTDAREDSKCSSRWSPALV